MRKIARSYRILLGILAIGVGIYLIYSSQWFGLVFIGAGIFYLYFFLR